MNKQAFSTLFSVLLATTFIYEIRAKGQPHALASHNIDKRNIRFPTHCKECNGRPGLLVQPGLLGFLRQEDNFMAICDHKANLFGLISGHGDNFLLNPLKKIGWLLRGGVLRNGVNPVSYFRSLQSLQSLTQIQGAIGFQVDSASLDIHKSINQYLPLMYEPSLFEDQIGIDETAGLSLVISSMTRLISGFTGSLPGFLNAKLGFNILPLPFDISGLTHNTIGLSTLFGAIPDSGNFDSMGLDITSLYTDGNGPLTLTNIMNSQAENIYSFGSLLNDDVTTLKLFAQLDAGPHNIFGVLANVMAFVHGQTNLEILLTVIIRFLTFSNSRKRVTYDMDETFGNFDGFLSVVERHKASKHLSGCVSFLRNIRHSKLVIKGVNISAMAKIFGRVSGRTLDAKALIEILVRVLLLLENIIPFNISLRVLIMILMMNFKSIWSGHLAKRIRIKFHHSLFAHLLGRRGRMFRLTNDLSTSLGRGDIHGCLFGLPLIGEVINVLQLVLRRLGVLINMKDVLNDQRSRILFNTIIKKYNYIGDAKIDVKPEAVELVDTVASGCNDPDNVWQVIPKRLPCNSCLVGEIQ